MADTPKSSLSLPRTTAEFFRTPSMEDDEAPLIGRTRDEADDDDKPTLKFTFSFVKLVRLLQLPLSIVACGFVGNPRRKPGLAALFVFFIVCNLIWNIFQLIDSIGRSGPKKKYGCQFGAFECYFGRVGSDPFHLRRRSTYMTNAIDLGFCCLMIIPSVLCLSVDIYGWWGDEVPAGALCITIASLQLILAFFGLFSFFRKVKVCVYPAEYDEKAGIRIPETYSDGDLLRGGPSTSGNAV